MAVRPPHVRHFIACEKVVASAATHRYSLLDIITNIRPKQPFPYRKELCLFAVLSDAHGIHELNVRLIRWEETGEEVEVWKTKTFRQDFRQDPLIVHGLPIRLTVEFDRPTLYEFRLCCGDEIIGREAMRLKGNP